jgi:hypothetical protein
LKKPERCDVMDEASKRRALDEFENMIRSALDGREKRDDVWLIVARLARQAYRLESLGKESDVERARTEQPDVAHMVMHAVRPMLEAVAEKNLTEMRRARIDELESLVRLRRTMYETDESTAEIDIRISAMKTVLFGREVARAA